ncbi:hypothetical protein AMTRI_Chr08g209480 [Amborella trichopoda]
MACHAFPLQLRSTIHSSLPFHHHSSKPLPLLQARNFAIGSSPERLKFRIHNDAIIRTRINRFMATKVEGKLCVHNEEMEVKRCIDAEEGENGGRIEGGRLESSQTEGNMDTHKGELIIEENNEKIELTPSYFEERMGTQKETVKILGCSNDQNTKNIGKTNLCRVGPSLMREKMRIHIENMELQAFLNEKSAENNGNIQKMKISPSFKMEEKTSTNNLEFKSRGAFREKNDGPERDPSLYIGLLRQCASRGMLMEGKGYHGCLIKTFLGLENILLFNFLAHMYAKCGSLEDAHRIFDEIPEYNVFSWTVMIVGYTQNGFPEEGFNYFVEMEAAGIQPDKYAFSAALQSCVALGALDNGKMVHAQIIKSRNSIHAYVCTSLMNMYARCDVIEDSSRVFETMADPNQVSWNAMISAYTQRDYHKEGLELYSKMVKQGVKPNLYTFACVLKACGKLGALAEGKNVHKYAKELDLESNSVVGTALIDMYAKCDCLSDARMVFDKLADNGDNVPWNAMISGYAQSGFTSQAVDLIIQMLMRSIRIDSFTYGSILNACAATKHLGLGEGIHGIIIKTCDYLNDLAVTHALADMYAKCGCLEEAVMVFEEIPEKDVISWTTMITAYAQNWQGDKAMEMFSKMRMENLSPNQFTFSSVLMGCSGLSLLEYGEQIHGLVYKLGFNEYACVGSSLIDMYAKCGCVLGARKVFKRVSDPDVVSWTSIISAYAQHGLANEALQLFDEMELTSIKPNGVTFLCVLFACSHGGLTDKGLYYFQLMRETYGIIAEKEHYACIVDLLGRSGRLDDALEFIKNLPVVPSPLVWQTLLGACRVHGNAELGKLAAGHVLSFEPEDSAAYVLLSNTYTSLGSLEIGISVRSLMRERGVKKEPGISWIVVGGRVHKFYVRDGRHPRRDEIYAKLGDLLDKVKTAGYVPDLTFV